jgi:hypothetical protein
MDLIKEEDMNFFMFVSCETKTTSLFNRIKAVLFLHGAIHVENINDKCFLFSTTLSYDTIKERLEPFKENYLVLDIGALYDLEHVFGRGPKIDLELFKSISLQKFSKEKPRLQRIMEDSLQKQKFELSAKLRDINKQHEC